MIDSTNPRQLADNIRKLWDKFKSISGDLLPSRSTATTGQILKLTGENKTPSWADEYSYTPPAYSETEVNTGKKWIDGRDVYMRSFDGDLPEIVSTITYTLSEMLSDITVITAQTSLTTAAGLLYVKNDNLFCGFLSGFGFFYFFRRVIVAGFRRGVGFGVVN